MSAWESARLWLGTLGTLAGLGWAIYVYWGTVKDKRRAQARLLSVVQGFGPLLQPPGSELPGEGVAEDGSVLSLASTPDGAVKVVAAKEMTAVGVHLVSKSDETFTILEVTLTQEDGRAVRFPLATSSMPPGAEWTRWAFYPAGHVKGPFQIRVRFMDASGRKWERAVAEPLKQLTEASYRKMIAERGHKQ